MENVNSYYFLAPAIKSFNSSGDSFESDPSFIYSSSSDSDVNDLTATFQELVIDVNGMVRELFEKNTDLHRDTDSIRQDFIRNGIDSSMTECLSSRRLPPPGIGVISKWPLSMCDNESSSATNPNGIKTDDSERKRNKGAFQSSRRKRSKENEDYCVFCYNNREEQETYLGHSCRDGEGFVVCPKLQRYVCPYCQATGHLAHTKKYCPKKPIITPDDLRSMTVPFDGPANTSGRNRSVGRGKKSLRF